MTSKMGKAIVYGLDRLKRGTLRRAVQKLNPAPSGTTRILWDEKGEEFIKKRERGRT